MQWQSSEQLNSIEQQLKRLHVPFEWIAKWSLPIVALGISSLALVLVGSWFVAVGILLFLILAGTPVVCLFVSDNKKHRELQALYQKNKQRFVQEQRERALQTEAAIAAYEQAYAVIAFRIDGTQQHLPTVEQLRYRRFKMGTLLRTEAPTNTLVTAQCLQWLTDFEQHESDPDYLLLLAWQRPPVAQCIKMLQIWQAVQQVKAQPKEHHDG